MPTSTSVQRTVLVGAVLVLTLGACGQQRASDSAAGAGSSASPSAPGASPYVEPGAGDGAPHYNENNAYRRTGEMSPAHERDAERDAARIEPVLKRLWEQGKWDPATVRAALLELGYEEGDDALTVQEMFRRFKNNEYYTPEGAMVGLRVHPDACVTAFVQKSNYGVQTNGPYLETGCFEPPYGH
ncbi:hypothetical protein [Streptomyces sp. GQFP]|uniref:hypothetical protein n=1 Tax=Streptomyces sp. GQFP TaxID=2907545 RepID=UPI001F37097C|nr:hypothetical protein [Streptomyces sp. GQFP]UIX32850.1 hypothetical protein LUX31_24100 [Streptomyces sp. GQFP]